MATVDDHRDAAWVEFQRLAQPEATPELDNTEMGEILDASQRASFWALSTAYVYGAVIMPTARNGHRYMCIQGGTSAATEPTWPTRDASTVTDGTVQWQEAGADFSNVFDVRKAANRAWLVKLAKASQLFDGSGQRLSQITEHCREMADSFGGVEIA